MSYCPDCGSPLNDDGTCPGVANHAENMPEREHETSKGVQEAEQQPEMVADAFARERPIEFLKNWLMGTGKEVSAAVREAAMKMASITTLVDAKEDDVRNAAYNAKIYLLQNPKR